MARRSMTPATPPAGPSISAPSPPPASPEQNQAQVLEIYKLLVEMADRVSQRRQSNNNFYMTVNTAVVGTTAYFATVQLKWLPTVAVSMAGLVICLAWWRSIHSYRTLNQAKFKVIDDLESNFSIRPFTDEWELLKADKRHVQFHSVETVVPFVFGALHFIQLALQARWADFFRYCAEMSTGQ